MNNIYWVIILGFKKNITAFSVISLLGVLGHFLYEIANKNRFVGLFFPVNESIWEHLKLIFFPSVIFFLIEYFSTKKTPQNYIEASIKGIFYGMLSVVAVYYTITGILGKNIDFINILIFFAAVFITVSVRNNIIARNTVFSKNKSIALYALCFLTALAFIFWSYNPPNLNIFIPPN